MCGFALLSSVARRVRREINCEMLRTMCVLGRYLENVVGVVDGWMGETESE
jgi:hypothetical protein